MFEAPPLTSSTQEPTFIGEVTLNTRSMWWKRSGRPRSEISRAGETSVRGRADVERRPRELLVPRQLRSAAEDGGGAGEAAGEEVDRDLPRPDRLLDHRAAVVGAHLGARLGDRALPARRAGRAAVLASAWVDLLTAGPRRTRRRRPRRSPSPRRACSPTSPAGRVSSRPGRAAGRRPPGRRAGGRRRRSRRRRRPGRGRRAARRSSLRRRASPAARRRSPAAPRAARTGSSRSGTPSRTPARGRP